jgi:hypothetical protein
MFEWKEGKGRKGRGREEGGYRYKPTTSLQAIKALWSMDDG